MGSFDSAQNADLVGIHILDTQGRFLELAISDFMEMMD